MVGKGWPGRPKPGQLMTSAVCRVGVAPDLTLPHDGFLASSSLLYLDAPTSSSSPFVHGFPRPLGDRRASECSGRGHPSWWNRGPGRAGPPARAAVGGEFPTGTLSVVPRVPSSPVVGVALGPPRGCTREFAPLCVSVVRVLSSTLLPGFFGPESSVLSVDLPPFAPLLAAGSPFASQFSTARERRRAGGLPGVRHTASPYPVQLQCTAGTPIGYGALLCHACSSPSIHPSSWFAVRYVHGFCLRLPSDLPFLGMPLPSVGVPLPSDHGGFQVTHLLFSACVSCPAHIMYYPQSG